MEQRTSERYLILILSSKLEPFFATRKGIRIPEFREIFAFGIQNPENFACGIQNPGLWNPECNSRNPESY